MITTRITIRQHLAEYCIGKWGTEFTEPVRFPVHSELYVSIYNLTKKRPTDCQLDKGNLEIVLPNRAIDEEMEIRKNPEVYNWISDRGCRYLDWKIELHFWMELHEMIDENRYRYGIPFSESIYTFMTKYRIEGITEDAMLKNYTRWKEKRRVREKRAYKKSQKK